MSGIERLSISAELDPRTKLEPPTSWGVWHLDEHLGWCWSTRLDWDFEDETVAQWVERSIDDSSGNLIDGYRMMVEEHPEFLVSDTGGRLNSVVAEVADIYQTGELGHHLYFPIYEDYVRSLLPHHDLPLKYGLTSNEFPLVLGGPTKVVVFRTLHPRDSKTLTDFDLDFPPELLAEYFRVGQDWVWKNIQGPAERLGPDGGDWDMEPELVEYQPRVHFDSASGATTSLSWSTGKSFWVRGRVGQQSTKSWVAAESQPSSPYMLIPKAAARVVLDLFDSHQVNVRDLAGILLSP